MGVVLQHLQREVLVEVLDLAQALLLQLLEALLLLVEAGECLLVHGVLDTAADLLEALFEGACDTLEHDVPGAEAEPAEVPVEVNPLVAGLEEQLELGKVLRLDGSRGQWDKLSELFDPVTPLAQPFSAGVEQGLPRNEPQHADLDLDEGVEQGLLDVVDVLDRFEGPHFRPVPLVLAVVFVPDLPEVEHPAVAQGGELVAVPVAELGQGGLQRKR